jgi:isopentenyl-diphosphate delta-isomerase
VHANGLKHKGVYVFLFDGEGRIFIQQRAAGKDTMPGRWDLSVAEHLKPKESYKEAALRGAMEELGVGAKNLEKIAEFWFHFKYENGKVDNELNQLFSAGFEGKIRIDKKELAEGRFVSKEWLLKEMKKKPESFTPWFLKCKRYL